MQSGDSAINLWQYIRAVTTHWVALMSGGAIIVALGLLERFSGRTVPTYVYVGVLILFIFIACYQAWRTERKRRIESESMLSQVKTELLEEKGKHRPDLEGIIAFTSFGSDDKGNTFIVVILSVRSLGMQTIIHNYKLSINLPSKGEIIVSPTHFEGRITIESDDQPGVSFDSKDMLYAKTHTKPIETGSMVEGGIVFVLQGVSKDEAYNARESLALLFEDVKGKVYVTKYPKADMNKAVPPRYLPGMPTKTISPKSSPGAKPKKPRRR
jgi:hypothetical protein